MSFLTSKTYTQDEHRDYIYFYNAVLILVLCVQNTHSLSVLDGKQQKGSTMTDQVNYSGLSKAEVLAALFNASAPGGMGFLQAAYGPTEMTVEDAEQLIGIGNTATPDMGGVQIPGRPTLYFDYLYGRPLKLDLTEDDVFGSWGFDRDNGGPGTAQAIIDRLKATRNVNTPESQQQHDELLEHNARITHEMVDTPSTMEGGTWHLGMSDVKGPVTRAMDDVLRRRRR